MTSKQCAANDGYMNTDRFRLLDSFRGMAILWIVIYHYLSSIKEGYGTAAGFFIGSGFMGVQIFFVISGYAISTSVHKIIKDNEPTISFLKKRVQRIYTPYFFCLFFIVFIIPGILGIFSALKGHPLKLNFNTEIFHHSILEFIKIVTLTEVFSSKSQELWRVFDHFNSPLWYLAILVQMYIVVAVLLLVLRKYYYQVVVLLSLLSFLTLVPSFRAHVPHGLFLPYWLQFSTGILLFYLISKGWFVMQDYSAHKGKYLFVIFLYLLISSAIFHHLFSFYSIRYYATFFSLSTGMLFWLIYPAERLFIKASFFRVFLFLGSFSYSLYLMHAPLKSFVSLFGRNISNLSAYFSVPIIEIPLVIALSYLWYLFFEKPGSVSGTANAVFHPLKTLRAASYGYQEKKLSSSEC